MSICPDKFDVIERDGINLEEAIQGIFSSSFENAFPGVSIAKVLIAPHREYDYQVNNALALAKSLKRDVHDIMQAIVDHLPKNALLDRVDTDPKGFLMIKINDSYLKNAVEHIATKGSYEIGVQRRETSNRRTVLVDFSSPNIAKDMHVGHLRSTIIGDCLCRIYEFTGHQVLRTNHVGDWGTQFGMLIAYLKQEYPHFLKVPPPIADLAAFYKKAKKEFDEVADFKAVAYSEVVALQQGNPEAVRAWTVLCDISRIEFQSMYDLLNVKLKEVGESFYRDWIPTALQKAEDAGMIQTLADGAKVIMPKEEFELTKTDAKALRRLFLSTFREFSKEVELHQLMGEELGIKESIVERGEIPLGSNKVTRIDQLDWQTEGEKVYKLCEKKLLPNGAKLHPTLKQLFRERGFLRVRSSKDTKEDDASAGIEVISIPRYEYPLIVVKRDGGYTYDTTDLAAVFYRSQILQAQHIVYVTDKGQAGHFQLIFAAAEDMGWVHPKLKSTTARSGTSVEHVDFGLVTGEDGKRLRTRSGDTVRLRDLIDEAISRCYEISKQREAEHPQGHTEEVLRDNARVLGVAAIKYYDLRQHRSTDYAFSYDKMCDLSGNTALYLLYAYVRVCGVLRKAAKMDKEKETSLPESESCPVTIDLSAHATQRALALHICRFGGTLDRVLEESMPSRLTDYTYQLVCKFSDLYAACPILGNESTMHLCRVTGYMIRTCLQLLGIDVVEKL